MSKGIMFAVDAMMAAKADAKEKVVLAERKRFERWLVTRGGSAMRRDGAYVESMARLWWECWQAALAAKRNK